MTWPHHPPRQSDRPRPERGSGQEQRPRPCSHTARKAGRPVIRVTVELDAPSADHDPLTIAAWVAFALQENPPGGVVIHRIDVEREDA